MAPRRGVEVEQEAPLAGLQFDQALSWRAGKPIPTGELLKRLDELSNELQEMDQEELDKDSFKNVAKELAGPNLLNHKDKGVRAFTACCLVDILKLCAPDAPFTASQLKDIFSSFITTILPALSDPSNTYNNQHKYVLVSLSEVKSIVLINDLPDPEGLTLHLFSSFFDIVSGSAKSSTGEQIAKDVQYHMIQIMVTLVDEVEQLPTPVIDVIMAQFLRASAPGGDKSKHENTSVDDKQDTLNPKELPDAYLMATQVCNFMPEKMSRYTSQYFNDVILDVSAGHKNRRGSDAAESDDEEVHSTGPTEIELKELKKAHRLLRELWRAAPDVLQNVVPQLEAELSVENTQLRLMAIETLGDILSGIGSAGAPTFPQPTMDPAAYPTAKLEDYPETIVTNSILTTPAAKHSFIQTHPAIYKSFLGRLKDKSLVIRAGCTTAIGRILATSAGGLGLSREEESDLVKRLGEMLRDSEEKVRLAAVKAVASLNLRDILTKIAPNGDVNTPGSVLCSLGDRARDPKSSVRSEAMTTLAKIWGVAAGEIASGNESAITALGGIPSRIIDARYASNPEIDVLIDHALFTQLLPLTYPPKRLKGLKNPDTLSQLNGDASFDPDKIRVERLLVLVKSLSPKAEKAFFGMMSFQKTFAAIMTVFLQRCEDYNGGVVDGDTKEAKRKLDQVIQMLTTPQFKLGDPQRTTNDLLKFAKMHHRRSYQLLRFAMDPEKDFKTVQNAIKEFEKHVDGPAAPAGLMDIFWPIIYRSSSLLYNKSHLPSILYFSRTNENDLGAAAHLLNHEISEKMPEVFINNVKELCKALQEDVPSETRDNGSGSVETLRTLAQFAKARPKDLPKDRKFVEALIKFALYGTPAKAAKYAVRTLLAATDRKEMHVKDLLDKTTKDWTFGEDHFLTKLATMSQLELLDSKLTGDSEDDILEITTRQILLQVRTVKEPGDPSWQPESEMDEECQAKVWALKTLVNRLRATADDAENAQKLAAPVYKVLNILIVKEGELSKEDNTPKHHKSRLRLVAAQLLLKLCQHKIFDSLLTPTNFDRLACVAQDETAEVRHGFIQKLQKYLVNGKIPVRFHTIMFLTAFEPEPKLKNSIVTWIRSQAKAFESKKSTVMESTFARLLSLLAHHPDYDEDPKNLEDFARYILYYLTTLSTEENLGLIFKYAERVKQTRDAVYPDKSERLYVMSDLAQLVIRKWELKKGWRLQVYPGKAPMGTALFAQLPSHEVAQEIAEKEYLPEEVEELVEKVVRDSGRRTKRKAVDDNGKPASKKQKSDSRPKAARSSTSRPIKEKKTPKPKKRNRSGSPDDFSTPMSGSVDRRKSGRGASARKAYAELDDNEADEEMLDGVAAWKYEGEDGSEIEEVDSEEDDDAAIPKSKKKASKESSPVSEPPSEAEPKAMDEDVDEEAPEHDGKEAEAEDSEEEVVEKEPTPPRSNGRTRTRKEPAVPVAKPAKVTKAKTKLPLNPKVNTPAKAKAPIGKAAGKSKVKEKPVASSRGTRSRAKEVLDAEESE